MEHCHEKTARFPLPARIRISPDSTRPRCSGVNIPVGFICHAAVHRNLAAPGDVRFPARCPDVACGSRLHGLENLLYRRGFRLARLSRNIFEIPANGFQRIDFAFNFTTRPEAELPVYLHRRTPTGDRVL